ncbi:MAG TPA: TetR family transcriptional regulator [Cyclobacteriaceae bacterium]
MTSKKVKPDLDTNTEAKIKNAARAVFHKKGFAATRTRDIAEEAGINLALLNYYFRSKEKLFNIIMLETFSGFIKSIVEVFNDETTTLENKVETIASAYIDLLTLEPQIPLFIMSELKRNPDHLLKTINVKNVLANSSFARQYQQGVKAGKIAPVHFLHFLMNLLGLTIFPFIASPMIQAIGDLKDGQFNKLMAERKLMIPRWAKAMLKAK